MAQEADNGEGTDFHAIANNFVSVTPLQIDLTKYSEVKQVSDWLRRFRLLIPSISESNCFIKY